MYVDSLRRGYQQSQHFRKQQVKRTRLVQPSCDGQKVADVVKKEVMAEQWHDAMQEEKKHPLVLLTLLVAMVKTDYVD